jgi:UDP-N-acetylmuramate dehydrogenase
VLTSPAPPLSTMTSLRLGGPPDELVEVTTREELYATVAGLDRDGVPALVLGAGSNVVVADAGLPGTAVRVASEGVAHDAEAPCAGALVLVEAGVQWDRLVEQAIASEWTGVEALSGIPGTVGAVPVQNVGAYGQEVAETLSAVHCWDRQQAAPRRFAWDDCEFGYRTSVFKRNPDRYVVGAVEFQFRRGSLGAAVRYEQLAAALEVPTGTRVPAEDVRAAVLALRRSKGMVLDPADHDTWSVGSFFTNPVLEPGRLPAGAPSWPQPAGGVKTSAAWLIEQAGFGRGYGDGPARISTKHSLAITNRGAATTEDVLSLARTIVAEVERRYAIRLEPEPRFVGCSL